MHAADLEGQRFEPIKKRRLFKIQNSVQSGSDPFAAGDHFARNFRVTSLVRIAERAQAAHRKVNQPQSQGQQRDIFENFPRFRFFVDHTGRSKTWNESARNRNSFDSMLDASGMIV